MNIDEILNRARERLKVSSDRKLASEVRVDPGQITDYRRGRRLPSDATMVRISNAAGLSAECGLVLLNMWRTTGDAHAAYSRIFKILKSDAPRTDSKEIRRTTAEQIAAQ